MQRGPDFMNHGVVIIDEPVCILPIFRTTTGGICDFSTFRKFQIILPYNSLAMHLWTEVHEIFHTCKTPQRLFAVKI